MIKSITPLISTLLLLGGSFLILAVPTWMAYLVLASIAIILVTQLASKYSHKLSLVWHFCAEFFGFCLLVVLFVGTIVMMNDLITF